MEELTTTIKKINKNPILKQIYSSYNFNYNDPVEFNSYIAKDFEYFSSPFEINNLDIIVDKLREYSDNNKKIAIFTKKNNSCIIAAYTLYILFNWITKGNTEFKLYENHTNFNFNTLNILIGVNIDYQPDNSIVIAENIPTGRYDRLHNPDKPFLRGDKPLYCVQTVNRNIEPANMRADNLNISTNDSDRSIPLIILKLIQGFLLSFDKTYGKELMAYDLEATGVSAFDELTEIGALKIKNFKIVDTFETLINPDMKIPHNITILTNITNEMVKNAPDIKSAIRKFDEWSKGIDTVIVHNGGFDISSIRKRFKKYCKRDFNVTRYDTRVLSQSIKPGSGLDLSSISADFNVILKNAHRALADAEATAKVFLKIVMMRNVRLTTFLKWNITLLCLSVLADENISITDENKILLNCGFRYKSSTRHPFVKKLKKYKLLNSTFDSMSISRNILNSFNPDKLFTVLSNKKNDVNIKSCKSKLFSDFMLTKPIKISFKQIKTGFIKRLSFIHPCGKNNKLPFFYTENVSQTNKTHSHLTLSDNNKKFKAVYFNPKNSNKTIRNSTIKYFLTVEKYGFLKLFKRNLIHIIEVI